MNGFEIFLIIIVTIWTLVFIAFGVVLVFVLFQLKKALDKVNQIVDTAQQSAEGVSNSLKTAAAGVVAIATRGLVSSVAKKIARSRSKNR